MTDKKIAILKTVLKYLYVNEIDQPLTIANIAHDLDMGKSTVYEYFSNKAEMIEEAIHLIIDENMTTLLEDEYDDEMSFKTMFKQYIQKSLSISAKNHITHNLADHTDVISLEKSRKERIKMHVLQSIERLNKRIKTIMQKGVAEKVIKPVPKTRYNTVEAMILGFVVSCGKPEGIPNAEAAIEDLYQSVCLLHQS